MPAGPPVQWYLGDARNTLTETHLEDGNHVLLTAANGAVSVSIVRNSDGAVLAANRPLTYSGTPGSWTLDQSQTAAAWFPSGDTLSIVYTSTDATGTTVFLTKTIPGRPQPPSYMSYKRLSRRTLVLTPENLVGGATAVASFFYQSGMAMFGPTAMQGSGPFSLTVDAHQWPAGDVITIVLAATDSLGLAYTQVLIAADDGD